MDKKTFILFFVCGLLLPWLLQAQGSVLREGGFYKVAVTENGIYKIDAALLNGLGIDPAATEPANVAVYGNGGGMLPQKNSAFRHRDLVENPVLAVGGGDGSFSGNDHVLFYAEGPDGHFYDPETDLLQHQQNLFSDTNYYFIKIKSTAAQTLDETSNTSISPDITLTNFDDFFVHEEDLYNQLDRNNNSAGSGRRWFGEIFEVTASRDYSFNIPGIVEESSLQLQAEVMAYAPQNTVFLFKVGGGILDSAAIAAVPTTTYGIKGRVVSAVSTHPVTASLAAENLTLTVEYDKKGGSGTGFLDFINLNVKRALALYGNQTIFRSKKSINADAIAYQVANVPENAQIWDITEPVQPKKQLVEWSNNQARFVSEGAALKEYIVFQGDDFPTPLPVGEVPAQNLHGLSTPNLIIVAADELLPEARRLAEFRQTHDGLTAEAVSLSQVYNEFSSGRPDMTAVRDFVRMLYLQNNDPVSGLRYVLLFGDASFDYRNILGKNKAMVPVYESYESLHPIYSFSSDDYFAFMDDEEGEWSETGSDVSHQMELGVGRMPVRTLQEAKAVVDKLMNYQANRQTLGDWRNRISFVADDGDINTHQLQADRLARYVEENYPLLNVDRLFVDAFPQVSTPFGKRSPALKDEITRQVEEKGVLILNYSGHGAETGWASENILDNAQVVGWQNLENLPLLVTATCEFGRYDDPRLTSGAEFSVLNSEGGAIALLTTTRPVFSNTNFLLNKAFYEVVFEQENGRMPRLGNIIKRTKNNSVNGVINRNFALLGDPSMQLAYPQEKVVVTQINGQNIDQMDVDTLRALQTVELSGEIRELGNLAADFQGTLDISVFDKFSEKKTLGEEGANTIMTFYNREVVLFKGKATVVDGKFTASFVVPKDISYRFGEGKISLYAKHENAIRDAGGFLDNLVVGGSYAGASPDNTVPEMQLFMEDESFVDGGIVGENTQLLVKLSDESGINMTGNGIGHDITATLRGGEGSSEIFILNDFYEAALDNFRKGTVLFPLNNLVPGAYSLEVKAWDNQNNAAVETIHFRVLDGETLSVDKLVAYPNPFRDKTTLSFMHNQAGSTLEVDVQIFAANGMLVSSFRREVSNSPALVNIVEWDGKNDYGALLGDGLYLAKLYIYNPETGAVSSPVFKVVISR